MTRTARARGISCRIRGHECYAIGNCPRSYICLTCMRIFGQPTVHGNPGRAYIWPVTELTLSRLLRANLIHRGPVGFRHNTSGN